MKSHLRRTLVVITLTAATLGFLRLSASTDARSVDVGTVPTRRALSAMALVPVGDPSSAGIEAVTRLYAVVGYESARVEAERVEAERQAQERAGAEAAARAVSVAGRSITAPAATSGCANPVVSEAIAARESGCRWDIVNYAGCGGRGCLGFYQLDAGHFYAVSPWNPNVSGTCYGLGDWHDPAVQTACASRLGVGAWG